jgi:hypothetical protein
MRAPLVDYLVVLFSADPAHWLPHSRFIRGIRSDFEGRYRLASLPPGAYRVAAVDDFEEADIHDPAALDQIRLRSVPAVLATGEVRVHHLVITTGQR